MTRRWPIVRLGRVGAEEAGRILAVAREQEPTYAPVAELLRPEPPPPDLDVTRDLGRGPEAFDRAVGCFRSLGQARAVATVWPTDAAAVPGTTLLVALALGPLTVVAINRVVAVVDEPDRWGFAYGTLPGHVEVGEEAFVVERRPDGTVVARITARARTALPAAGLLQHLLVPIQRRYAARYLDAVARAVTVTADGAHG